MFSHKHVDGPITHEILENSKTIDFTIPLFSSCLLESKNAQIKIFKKKSDLQTLWEKGIVLNTVVWL